MALPSRPNQQCTPDLPWGPCIPPCCIDLQDVKGDLQIAVEWQFTREGLLLREVELLERVLAEKVRV